MDANRPIHFATATKQATECKVSFDRLVVDPNHRQEMFERLVGLLIEQKVKALQIIDIQRWWRIFIVTFAKSSHSPTGGGQ